MNRSPESIKIYFVNSNKVWGGGEKWNLETASVLNNKGYQVSVLAAPDKELYVRSGTAGLCTMPVKISNLSFINPLKMIRMVIMFRKNMPDVLVISLSSDLKAAGIAAYMAGVKRIVYRRGMAVPIRNTFLNRYLFGTVITDVIANSEDTKRTLFSRNSRFLPADKVMVIYNGIDPELYDINNTVKDQQGKSGCLYIGTAGRLEPEKNHKALIQVASILKRKGVRFKMIIAGKGSLHNDLQHLAATENVCDVVEFAGFIDPIQSFLQHIDVFVLPSVYEGFGYVKIEAMACRRPVVAFNVSSNPEVVTDGKSGFLIELNNLNEFSAKLKLLADNPELRRDMGEYGRKRVEQFFNIQNSIARFEELLTSVNS